MAFKIIYVLFIFIGICIVIIWTRDILTNPFIDLSGGFFAARDKESGKLFWPHWFAEYITSFLLILAPILVFFNCEPGYRLMHFAAGALFYTSLNSLGWTFASKERIPYTIPITFALVVSAVYLILLIN